MVQYSAVHGGNMVVQSIMLTLPTELGYVDVGFWFCQKEL